MYFTLLYIANGSSATIRGKDQEMAFFGVRDARALQEADKKGELYGRSEFLLFGFSRWH